MGFGIGAMWFILYCVFSTAFAFGIKLMRDGEPGLEPGNVLTVSRANINLESGINFALRITCCHRRLNQQVNCFLNTFYYNNNMLVIRDVIQSCISNRKNIY